MTSLEQCLTQQGHKLGFDRIGIAAAVEADDFAHFTSWLAQGHAGTMAYMSKQTAARRHPASILPAVRSVIMTAMNYNCDNSERAAGFNPAVETSPAARIARYARGQADYHDVLWERLEELLGWLQVQVPGCRGRAVVDTAPLLERDFARRAGLGWFGKNTMLIDKRLGSYFFLGALLVDVELKPSLPHTASHCGTCTACLDACPTGAFPSPHVLDARKCISYLTIELRDPVPEGLRTGVGDWLYGCDVCQEVCPWNRKAPLSREPAFAPRADLDPADPLEILALSEEEFRQRFRHTALWRAKRRGLLRNACLVLGNTGGRSALPALQHALDDPEPLIRDAATWAIARINELTNTI